jgi:hypothetical protein
MLYTQSYQLYKYEHGLTAAEQRAADVRAGETAAALAATRAAAVAATRAAITGALRLCLGWAFRLGHHARPASGAADAKTASAQVLSGVR